MLRLRPKLIGKFRPNYFHHTDRRHFSSQGSSKFKISLILGGGSITITSLTLAYAKYNKQFADKLTFYAPFLKSLLYEDNSNLRKYKENDIFSFPKKEIVKPVGTSKSAISIDKNHNEEKLNSKQEDKDALTKPIKVEEEKTYEKNEFRLNEKDLKKEIEKNLQSKKEDKHELENEFRGQLKRLLYAFNEFYEEKRILYETENKRKQEIELKNYLIQERTAMTEEYEKSFKKLKQMENLLQIRDKLDKQEKASKKLWLLSQILSKLLEHNRSLSKETMPINIREKIDCIREVVKDNFANEALIQVALDSLSENAIKNGVYSEEDLIRRFKNVHKICSRVTLVDKDYTNIFGYLKSYAYSYIRPFFQIDFEISLNPIKVREIPQEELEGKLEVDPKEWDAYDILQRVSLCVEHRNLEMALRYANLLSGETYYVARDWIKDTREHLEVKQVLELLQTKIASINLHQLSFSV